MQWYRFRFVEGVFYVYQFYKFSQRLLSAAADDKRWNNVIGCAQSTKSSGPSRWRRILIVIDHDRSAYMLRDGMYKWRVWSVKRRSILCSNSSLRAMKEKSWRASEKKKKHCGEEIWCKDQHEFKSMLNTRMIEKILPISSGRRLNENNFDSNSSVLE